MSRSPFSLANLSLKWRLFTLQSLLVFAIVASIGIISFLDLEASIEQSQRHRLLAIAKEISDISSYDLKNAETLLRNLAKEDAMIKDNARGAEKTISAAFRQYKDLFPELAYINGQGDETAKIIGGKPATERKNYSTSALYKHAAARRGVVVVGMPYMSASLNEPAIDMVCRGCGDNPDNDFTLRASLPLRLLNDSVADIQIPSKGFFLLMDNGRNILASTFPAKLALPFLAVSGNQNIEADVKLKNNKPIFGRYQMLGCDCMIVDSSSTLGDLKSIVAMPYEVYQGPTQRLKQSIIFICLTAFAVSILIVGLALQRFMSPINLLTKTAADIALSGELDRQVQWQSEDEIGMLARSFNTMLSRLSHTHKELTRERSYIENILLSLADMLIVTDREGYVVQINKSCMETLKFHNNDIIGQPVSRLFKGGKSLMASVLTDTGESKPMRNIETIMLASDGTEIPVSTSVARVSTGNDDESSYDLVFIAKDITENKRNERKIHYLAMHDSLTGLANRILLMQRLEHALTRVPMGNRYLAVLFLDLDRLKEINDALGHDVGDELLRMVGERLKKNVRQGDTVARIGGDEYVIVLTDLDSKDDVAVIAKKIIADVSLPFHINGHECHTGVSIGASVAPGDSTHASTLLKCADTAMYRAKEAGRNDFVLYSEPFYSRSCG